MPTYDIKNTETGEEKEVFMSYGTLQEYLALNPEWVSIHKKTGGFIPENGDIISKMPSSYNDLLKSIKKGSGRSNTIKTK